MKQYVVRNGLQEMEFEGEKLSSASTERDNSVRWTEINIYKTRGGNYVIVTLGVSVVYHAGGSRCTSKGSEMEGYRLPLDAEPCSMCRPGSDDDALYIMERNLSRAKVVEDPRRLEEAMITQDDKRKVYDLSPVAREALNSAAAQDPALLNQIITPVRID